MTKKVNRNIRVIHGTKVYFRQLLGLEVEELSAGQHEDVQTLIRDSRETLDRQLVSYYKSVTADYTWYSKLLSDFDSLDTEYTAKLSSFSSAVFVKFPLSKQLLVDYLRVMRAAGYKRLDPLDFADLKDEASIQIDMTKDDHYVYAEFSVNLTGSTCKLVPCGKETVVDRKEVIKYKMVCDGSDEAIESLPDEEELDG